jgi:hypothetical protein
MILNNWQMYYKVTFLSEICLSTGKGIQPYFLTFKHEILTRQSSSNLNWPVQSKPDAASFKIWTRCIKSSFINRENHQIPVLSQWKLAGSDTGVSTASLLSILRQKNLLTIS